MWLVLADENNLRVLQAPQREVLGAKRMLQ